MVGREVQILVSLGLISVNYGLQAAIILPGNVCIRNGRLLLSSSSLFDLMLRRPCSYAVVIHMSSMCALDK